MITHTFTPEAGQCAVAETMTITVKECTSAGISESLSSNTKVYAFEKVVYVQTTASLERVSITNSIGNEKQLLSRFGEHTFRHLYRYSRDCSGIVKL